MPWDLQPTPHPPVVAHVQYYTAACSWVAYGLSLNARESCDQRLPSNRYSPSESAGLRPRLPRIHTALCNASGAMQLPYQATIPAQAPCQGMPRDLIWFRCKRWRKRCINDPRFRNAVGPLVGESRNPPPIMQVGQQRPRCAGRCVHAGQAQMSEGFLSSRFLDEAAQDESESGKLGL